MAFRQPAFHAPPRAHAAAEDSQISTQAYQTEQPLEESQEWILFSPAPASSSYLTEATSTDRTRRTLGHSRNSAFGSLDTAARSFEYDEEGSEHTEGGLEDDDDDGELDSLDSHLHEFRAESSVYDETSRDALNVSSNPVLPTHDGLGSFRVDQTTMGDGVQQHLYAFEQYNPRRIKRRRESLELGQLELDSDRVADLERTRRIEEWRLNQSKALLEEIQKESRRRKESMSTDRRSLLFDIDDAEAASLGAAAPRAEATQEEAEGFWSRITRRVIRDLMGIDDNMLSILFGEALPLDDDLSTTPTTPSALAQLRGMKQDSWEYRLLDRVARELGLLINQLSDHPGAFSTYLQTREEPLPYAGLPIIPESVQATPVQRRLSNLTASTPQFRPTIPQTAAVDISGSRTDYIQEDDIDATPRATAPIHEQAIASVDFTKDEWEKQLDIKMVFRYLRSRFTSRDSSPEPPIQRSLSSPTLQTTLYNHQNTDQARAARVRQHHPLVNRQERKAERNMSKSYRVSVPTHSPILHRRSSSSCASLKKKSGSSRHYWDLGGSMGSGSLLASGGGLGAWGEV